MKNDSSDFNQVDQWSLFPLTLFFFIHLFLVFVWGCVCVRGGGQEERGPKDKNGVC